MQKLLITGGAGLLGLNWALQARQQYEVHILLHEQQVFIDGVFSHKADWNDERSLTQIFKKISPRIVINTVGCTDLDLCETNPTISFLSNVKVAEICARLAEGTNARYVHISTDHLFDGLSAYAPESKKPKPLNTYARHKAQAEIAVHKACHSALICRTNFIGWGPTYRRSFSDKILDTLSKNETLRMFEDVFFTPVSITMLIDYVHALLDISHTGIINVCSSEKISKYDFSVRVAKTFGFNSDHIQPVHSDSFRNQLVRPNDLSLCNHLLVRKLRLKAPSIDDVLESLIKTQKNFDELFTVDQKIQ